MKKISPALAGIRLQQRQQGKSNKEGFALVKTMHGISQDDVLDIEIDDVNSPQYLVIKNKHTGMAYDQWNNPIDPPAKDAPAPAASEASEAPSASAAAEAPAADMAFVASATKPETYDTPDADDTTADVPADDDNDDSGPCIHSLLLQALAQAFAAHIDASSASAAPRIELVDVRIGAIRIK